MNAVKKGNKTMFIFLCVLVFGSLLASLIYGLLSIEPSALQDILLTQVGLITIPIILYFIITKKNIKATLNLNKIGVINVLFAIGIGIFIQPLLSLVNVLSQLYSTNYVSETVLSILDLPYFLLLLCIAIIPAINEEIITRGILLHYYKNVPIFKKALISGLFFGIFHLNLNQFSYAFVMGFILCLMVEVTNSIYTGMIIHFIVNATQITLFKVVMLLQDFFNKYFNADMTSNAIMTTADTSDSVISLLPFVFGAALIITPIAFYIFWGTVKYNKHPLFSRNTRPLNPQKRTKVITSYLSACLIIFLSYTIMFEFLLPRLIEN